MRTVAEMVADLLQIAIDSQWSDEVNTACHCHPEYTPCCPACGERKYQDLPRHKGEHAADCSRVALLNEIRAFLTVENELAEARGEDTVWIP